MPDQPALNYERAARRDRRPVTPAHFLLHVLISFLPLVAALPLPAWTVWYIGPWEATGEYATAIDVVRLIPSNLRSAGLGGTLGCHSGNLVTAGCLIALGAVSSVLLSAHRRSRG
ncbi:MAG TPA: hypothetical protein VF796_09335 [Humisphaera sp.]